MLGTDKQRLYEKYRFLKGSVVVVEGNIASGKSTLTEGLVEFLNDLGLKAKLYKEPILQTYLDAFLKDMPRYAFGFQMSMLIENQCLYGDAQRFTESGGIAVMDRSFMGNRAFALLHYQYKNIDSHDMKIYDDVYRRMEQSQKPSYIIYLEVSPSVNIGRCQKRDRTCEKEAYDLQYFSDLNAIYRQLISELMESQKVLVFDWNMDIPPNRYREALLNVIDSLRNDYLAL